MCSFFANSAQDPLWQCTLAAPEAKSAQGSMPLEEWQAAVLAAKFEKIMKHLQEELVRAQAVHQEEADKRRKLSPAFGVRDYVWSKVKNVSTQCRSSKLDHRRL